MLPGDLETAPQQVSDRIQVVQSDARTDITDWFRNLESQILDLGMLQHRQFCASFQCLVFALMFCQQVELNTLIPMIERQFRAQCREPLDGRTIDVSYATTR